MAIQRPFYQLIKATGIVGLALTMVCSLLFVFGGLAKPVEAAPLWTPVTNPINVDTIWTPAGSPYTISGVVNVTAKLVINPGVEVRFNHQTPGSQLYFGVGGQLVAIGTPAQPITFTSNEPSPSPGDWDGLIFSPSALSSTVQYAVIEYAREGLHLASFVTFNILSNTLRYNGQGGLEGAITGSPDNSTISFNKVYSSWGGLIIDEVGGDVIQGNEMYSIENDCIDITSAGAPSSNNKVLNNTLYNCRGRGINLEGGLNIGGNNQVISNTIWNINQEAVRVSDQNNFRLWQNTVYSTALTNTVSAVYLYKVNGATLRNNYLFNNGAANVYEGALRVEDSDDDAWSFVLTGTRLLDNYGSGFLFTGTNRFSPQTIHSNAICVTDKYEIENLGPEAITAAGNWLGTNSPVVGEQITGTVTYSPYIQLTAVASPLVVPADGLSTAVITLTMHDGQGHTMPLGARQLQLTRTLGSLNDTSLDLNNSGIATTSIRSASVGRAVITVTEWCGQAVTATVEFTTTDVAVSKTAAVTQVIPGQTVTYTIVFSNNNAIAATNIFITDTLPANMQVVSADIPPGFSRFFSGQDVIWTHPSLGGYVTGTIALVARLNPAAAPIACGQRLTNTVVITTATVDANPGNERGEAGVNVICADVGINKTTTLTQVIPGHTVTYTLAFSNTGQAEAANVVITDTLPPNVTWLTDNAPSQGWTRSQTNPPVWTRSTLAAGASGSFTLVGQTSSAIGCNTPLTNQAVITSTTPDRGLNSKNASVGGITTICADVSIRKVGPPSVAVGTTITYTLYYSNTGLAPAANVVITDVNPITGGVDTLVNGAALAPGQALSVTYPVFVPASICPASTLTNTGYINTTTPESATTNNLSTFANSVLCHDVVITKALARTASSLGKESVFSVTYRNIGVYTAYNVVITDFLAANVVYVNGPVTATGAITWPIGEVGPNQGGVFTVSLRLNVSPTFCSNGFISFTNRVRIDSYPLDNTSNNESIANSGNIPCNNVDLVIVKNDGIGGMPGVEPPWVYAGDVFTYTIVYNNAGGETATGVVITETIPAYTQFVSGTPSGWTSIGGGRYTFTLGDVASGAGGRLYLAVRVVPTLPNTVTVVYNTIIIGSNEADAYPQDNVSYENTPVRAIPDLVVTKTALTPVVRPGDYITYRITVTNQGFGDASNVTLTDTLPAATTYISDTMPYPRRGSDPVAWDIGSLPANGTISFILILQADSTVCQADWLINSVIATSTEPDATSATNTDLETVPTGCRDVAIGKTALPAVTTLSRPVTFTLRYSNPGLITATTIVVTDTLPAGLNFTGSTPLPDAINGRTYTWSTLGSLSPNGAFGLITLTAVVNDDGALCSQILTNTAGITATFTGGGLEPYLGNNRADASLLVRCIPDLGVLKNDRIGVTSAGEPPFVQAGDVFTYSIYYANIGAGQANGSVLTETLPNYTTFVGPAGWLRVGVTNQYTYALDTLPRNAGGRVEFAVRVTDPLPPAMYGSFITNTVCIGNQTDELDPSDNCSYENTPVRDGARLIVAKIANPTSGSLVQAGQPILYDVIIINNGRDIAHNVRLTDTLPLTYVVFITASLNSIPLAASNPLTASLGDMPVNGVVLLHVGVVVRNVISGTTFTNTAYASADGLPVQASLPVTHTVQTVGLAATKAAIPAHGSNVIPADLITYTIRVTNTSATLPVNEVRITDFVPLNTTLVSSRTSQGQVTSNIPLVVDVGTLLPSGQVVFTFTVRVNNGVASGVVIPNMAWASSSQNGLLTQTNVVTHLVVSPALSATKTAVPVSGSSVMPGQAITYTIRVTNTGLVTATNVVITDSLPISVTFVNSATTCGVVSGSNPLVARLGALSPTRTCVFTFTVQVANTAPNGQIITNTGQVDSDQTIISPTNQVSHTVIAPALQITKTASPAGGSTVIPTQRLTYTVIARNNGLAAATTVRITDTLPLTAVNFITATLSTGDLVYRQGNTLTATVSSLASASQVTMTVVVTVNNVISGTIFTNIAAAVANTLPVAWSLPVTHIVTLPITTDIRISKTANLIQATPGYTVAFTLTYAYSGTVAANNVVITDTLPAQMDFASSAPPPTISDTVRRVYTWTLGSVTPGISRTIVITANVQTGVVSGTVLTNIARITTTSPDGNLANNVATATIRVVDGIDLFVMKSDNVNSPPASPHVHPGDVITYTISYLNLGNRPASSVVITETLPISTVFLGPTGPLGWTQVGGGRDYTYLIGPLGAGNGNVITFAVQVLMPTLPFITNTVCIAGAEEDVVPGNNCWLVVTPVDTIPPITPTLGITKTASPAGGSPVQAGQTITYTVVVSNNTGAAINNTRITDTLPLTEVNFITATLSTGGPVYRQSNTLTATVPSLTSGSRVTMTVVVTVNTIITGTIFTNTATASADSLAVVTATVTHIVGAGPITSPLGIVKLANPDATIHAGQPLTYTVIVTNNTSAAAMVRITDTLPVSYVTFMGANLSSGGSGVFISPTLTATVAITPGGRITLTILVMVNTTAPVGTVFTNTAWAGASGLPVVTATVSHQVITNSAVYLPIILKNYTPPSASLVWRDQNDDLVSEVDGSAPSAFTPDDRADGAFILTVNTGGAAKTVTTVTLVSTQSATWNTIPGDGVIVLGIFNGGARLNNANGSINQSITGQAVVTLYASDDLSGSRFPPDTYDYTVYVTFSDGSMVSASARIPPPPPSNCGPYKILRVGNDPHGVAVDVAHRRVYVANYGSNSVSVVNTDNNTLLQTITGITKANGIAYDTANNIIWVTNQMDYRVTPIQANADATSFTVLPSVMVGSNPWGVAVDSTHGLVYVVNNISNSVTVINAATRGVVGTVTGQFSQPFHVAVNQTTGKAYIPNFGGPSVTVLQGTTFNKSIPLYDSTQPYGVAVDELRDVVYVTTVNTHRIVILGTNKTTGQPDELLNWAEFHRGWNPGRPVPLRAIAVNATIPSNPPVMEDGGHVWATTSTNDGSELNQALLIPKGGISYFHSPVPCNEVSTNPAEGIAVNPDTDRVYVTSGAANGWLTVFTDPVVPPLIYLDVDDNAITIEYDKEK